MFFMLNPLFLNNRKFYRTQLSYNFQMKMLMNRSAKTMLQNLFLDFFILSVEMTFLCVIIIKHFKQIEKGEINMFFWQTYFYKVD
jgi:hypothetical protein